MVLSTKNVSKVNYFHGKFQWNEYRTQVSSVHEFAIHVAARSIA